MSERDELAEIIRAIDGPATLGGLEVADGLLAAGYRKPRTITTVEELDALKPDAVVRSFMEVIYERTFSFRTPNKPYWQSPGNELPTASS
ncbi:hypothetical protein, partial [Pseudarthrobacter sp. PS3-L1]|uniref:hypothetical protein n=1 Tax=Pseudarthrobacter sp. PS3-L1 TaxID=3046207 RepID=UPI0024B99D83